VLRDTDGERFVGNLKVCGFEGEFVSHKKGNQCAEIGLMIKTFLYAITYPLAIELFALRKDQCTTTNTMNLSVVRNGPSQIELGVAKNVSITIMHHLAGSD